MRPDSKTSQLQIRISPRQKTALLRACRRAGMDMSAYILAKAIPPEQERFDALTARLAVSTVPEFELAGLNDLLTSATSGQFAQITANPPPVTLSAVHANYVAAMVEYAAGKLGTRPPAWVRQIPPLTEPVFGTDLLSLRSYLLTHSPAPYRRRNIFIDSSLGDRV